MIENDRLRISNDRLRISNDRQNRRPGEFNWGRLLLDITQFIREWYSIHATCTTSRVRLDIHAYHFLKVLVE
jgi:hypothetical protein